jgi:hypothetical protein
MLTLATPAARSRALAQRSCLPLPLDLPDGLACRPQILQFIHGGAVSTDLAGRHRAGPCPGSAGVAIPGGWPGAIPRSALLFKGPMPRLHCARHLPRRRGVARCLLPPGR